MILNYLRLTFSIEPEKTIILPPYKGSALRGGFGSVFRRVVCVLKKETCSCCFLREQCAYSYIFETAPSPESVPITLEKYEAIPRPFVIEPPKETKRIYKRGEKMDFNLVLIGRAIAYLPYFIIVFDELGQIGLGQKKGNFHLKKVWNKGSLIYSNEKKTLKVVEPNIMEIPDQLEIKESTGSEIDMTLEFLTPVRLRYQRDLVVMPEFHILIRNILRRLWLLSYFHGEMKEPSWNHREIIEAAKEVRIKNSFLQWYDWERYSGRQKTRMRLGGLVGRISYHGRIRPFLPLIKAGSIFHVGKGTAFGLGEYAIIEE
ncbi:MAG: CRISPR system precrRNA processing endoribonuclease RAMP protein Cas6 [Clostridiales bacterium]|nr:CRISPR system precrRNA processing endoribonuclease RAMP protein Cas6 [Clostridiales bacterium]